jgi:hypothetical protein
LILLKIIGLSIFFACFCRKDNDQEAHEFIDENNLDLDNDEEYLHPKEVCLIKKTYFFNENKLSRMNLCLLIDLLLMLNV